MDSIEYDALLGELKSLRASDTWKYLRARAAQRAGVRRDVVMANDLRDPHALTEIARTQGEIRATCELFGLGDYVSLLDDEITSVERAVKNRDKEA